VPRRMSSRGLLRPNAAADGRISMLIIINNAPVP
jgi:hypothetical protein